MPNVPTIPTHLVRLTKYASTELPMSHHVNPGLVAAIWAAMVSAVGSMIMVMGTRMATHTADMYRSRLLHPGKAGYMLISYLRQLVP